MRSAAIVTMCNRVEVERAMKTYDAVLLMAVIGWWLMFRDKYDWRAIVLFYMGGVFVADIVCGVLILVAYAHQPNVLTLPALLMPIGGIGGLAYAASRNQLAKGSDLFTKSRQKQ